MPSYGPEPYDQPHSTSTHVINIMGKKMPKIYFVSLSETKHIEKTPKEGHWTDCPLASGIRNEKTPTATEIGPFTYIVAGEAT